MIKIQNEIWLFGAKATPLGFDNDRFFFVAHSFPSFGNVVRVFYMLNKQLINWLQMSWTLDYGSKYLKPNTCITSSSMTRSPIQSHRMETVSVASLKPHNRLLFFSISIVMCTIQLFIEIVTLYSKWVNSLKRIIRSKCDWLKRHEAIFCRAKR